MAEKIVSPGVFTSEVDQSFLPAGIAAIGAAVVGPTQKGPAMVPTVVSSYSEFLQKFGGSFASGSGASEKEYKYLTNYSAQEYLKYADTLTVVRILAGDYSPAASSVDSSGGTTVAAAASVELASLGTASYNYANGSGETNGIRIETAAGALIATLISGSTNFFNATSNQGSFKLITGLRDVINNNAELSAQLSASVDGTVLQLTSSIAGTAGNGITVYTGSLFQVEYNQPTAAVLGATLSGGTEQSTAVFTLTTLADGTDQNSYTAVEGTNGLLASGSNNNVRWEIVNRNETKGTFGLLVRRGNDTNRRKVILEQYNNLTMAKHLSVNRSLHNI